jgi:hypothetical protein
MYFDGNASYVYYNTSNASFDFGSNSFTIEMWINPSSASVNGTQRHLFGRRPGTVDYASVIGLLQYDSTTGKYSPRVYGSFNGTTWGVTMIGGFVISPNTWTHLALVRNGSTWNLYVNGQSVGSAASALALYEPYTFFFVGATCGNSPSTYSGYMDDFRVTKGVARYTANFTPPGPI